eukprot:739148-Rhodomonas_salina.3
MAQRPQQEGSLPRVFEAVQRLQRHVCLIDRMLCETTLVAPLTQAKCDRAQKRNSARGGGGGGGTSRAKEGLEDKPHGEASRFTWTCTPPVKDWSWLSIGPGTS